MRKLYLATFVVLLLATVASAADLVSQYHIWYDTPTSCPASPATTVWRHWDQDFGDFTSRNACNFVGGTTWLRDTSHVTYPLIGPYDSDNTAVMRWHMRLAKAAGYSAFLVSVFPGTTSSGEFTTFSARFLTMLQIASEENFKIGLELWTPLGGTSASTFYSRTQSIIDSAVASQYSSALYRINNLPVVWFVFWARWDTNANLTNNLLNTRQAFWIISGDLSVSELNAMTLTNGAQKTQLVTNNNPTTSGFNFHGDISDQLDTMGAAGYSRVTHTYPHFNEAGVFTAERFGLGNDGAVVSSWHGEALAGAAAMVIIESWNDGSEMTAVEPGFDIETWVDYDQEEIYWTGATSDPYRPLKQLAALQGLSWVTPAVRCSIVDPVLVSASMTTCSSDTTAPTTPGSLLVSSVTATSVNLTWTASTDGVGVYGYHVERCTGAACSNFAQVSLPTSASLSNTGLSSSTTYRYRVRASDGAGNFSAYSSIVDATTSSGSGGLTYVLDNFENGMRIVQPGESNPNLRTNWGYSCTGCTVSVGITTDQARDGTHSLDVLKTAGGDLQFHFYTYIVGIPGWTEGWNLISKFANNPSLNPAGGSPPWPSPGQINRLRFWIRMPASMPQSAPAKHNFEFGTYIRCSTCGFAEDGGNHYYHFFDFYNAEGEWQQAIVDMHPDHQRGGFGNAEWPDNPPTDPVSTGYNYFDLMTRFYFDFPYTFVNNGDHVYIDGVEAYAELNPENTEQIRSLTGVYIPKTNELRLGWTRRKDQESSPNFEVRYAFSDIHASGFTSATLAATVPPNCCNGDNMTSYSTTGISVSGQSVIYMAIRPVGATLFRQIAIPLRSMGSPTGLIVSSRRRVH